MLKIANFGYEIRNDVISYNFMYEPVTDVEKLIMNNKIYMSSLTYDFIEDLKIIIKTCIKLEDKNIITEILEKHEKKLKEEENFINKLLQKYCEKVKESEVIENLKLHKKEKYIFPDYYYLLSKKIDNFDKEENNKKYKKKMSFIQNERKVIEELKLSEQLKNIILKKYDYDYSF